MSIVLIILSLFGALVGALSLSRATMGVGFLCGACLLAILARIAQVWDQHKQLVKKLDARIRTVEPKNKTSLYSNLEIEPDNDTARIHP